MTQQAIVEVRVTTEDIANGERWHTSRSPIGLAAARALGVPFVRVDSARIELPDGGRAVLPWEASEWQGRHDRGEHVEPFTFTLPAPGGAA